MAPILTPRRAPRIQRVVKFLTFFRPMGWFLGFQRHKGDIGPADQLAVAPCGAERSLRPVPIG